MRAKKIVALATSAALALSLSGCRESEKVNYNMKRDADYFETERRITVYNAMSDKVLLEVEGYMSITNDSENELTVICKIGPNKYKRNYIYLGAFTLYVLEDIDGEHSDPYHYHIDLHVGPQVDFDLKH